MTDTPKVLTVTLNPAVDVTYHLPDLTIGEVHRVDQTCKRAGGKGLNVARVLHQLGIEVTALAIVGGPTGRLLAAEFATSNINADFLELADAETRRTVTIVEASGRSTLFNESGPVVDEKELDRISCWIGRHAPHHDVVVFSGRLPPGLGHTAYAKLIDLARQAGAQTVLDTSGPALLAGAKARPDLIKPNREELGEATGTTDPSDGAEILRQAGATAVAVSLGENGLFVSTTEGCWQAPVCEPVVGNATGAGDATVAGLVMGLLSERSWPQRIALGVAAGTAAVLSRTAGQIDPDVFSGLRDSIQAATHAVPTPARRS